MSATSLPEAALLYETLRERQGSVTTPTTTLSTSQSNAFRFVSRSLLLAEQV
ncbi:MAG: hypothetical protein V7K14_29695 [Nostoc sp.]|uniref:hypothetical protein n=1 Tax=Nostoc sp. TaxID=1180 RepID=UPI002FFB01A2